MSGDGDVHGLVIAVDGVVCKESATRSPSVLACEGKHTVHVERIVGHLDEVVRRLIGSFWSTTKWRGSRDDVWCGMKQRRTQAREGCQPLL
jgi:hypothetical protein